MNWIAVLTVAMCAGSFPCFGQAESPLERLHALKLPSEQGSVPVVYSTVAKARAVRYRSALEAAHTWYGAQLDMSVPVTLAVLDRQDWARASTVPYPMPNSKPGLITVPFRIEDFPGFAEMQADADILAEIISFHEMGHLFAHKAGIRSTHSWVNELVANVFAQAYILAHQPELESYRSAPIPAAMSPRYTSLADLDYLNSDMSFSNYAWFQFQLNRLGAFLAQQQDLRTAVRHLQAAFQATEDVHLTSREVLQHMESIVGGFADQLGLLSQPTTIRRVNESICHSGPLAEGAPSLLIVDNQTPGEVTVSRAGREPNAVGAWQSRRVKVVAGEQLRLSTGGCVLATDEPTVAVIQKAR